VTLYGCETWTLKAVDKRGTQGLEMTAYRRLLRVSWTAHRTNASVLQKVQPQELYSDVSCGISAKWSDPETCALKYWKEDSLVREDEAGRGEDGQMISRTGQTEQWWCSLHGWRGTGNNGERW